MNHIIKNLIFSIIAIFSVSVIACGGEGSKGVAKVWSWTHPASLADTFSPDGSDANSQRVAMDNNGNTVIVWAQSDGTNQQIFKSEYRNGVWTHPSSLTDNISPDGKDANNPQIAMNNNGNAIIVWSQSDTAKEQIFKSEYRNSAWTYPSSLTDNISPNGQNAVEPKVAMDDDGNAVIVWRQSDGTNEQIYKSEYRGGVWTNPSFLISDHISLNGYNAGYNPQIAMDNNGNTVIVWNQFTGANYHVFKSEYRNNAWVHPLLITDKISPDGQDTDEPRVAMDNNGNIIILWRQSDGTDVQVFKSEYRSNAWTNPSSLISDHISLDGWDANTAHVVMDDNGNAIIVWAQSDGTNPQIFKSEYRGGTWTHPSSLTGNISPDGKIARDPLIAMDNNGNAIISWSQYVSSTLQVFKSEYRNGAWVHPVSLADYISPDGPHAYYPQPAMDDNNNAVIVWRQYDGISYDRIFKSEYR